MRIQASPINFEPLELMFPSLPWDKKDAISHMAGKLSLYSCEHEGCRHPGTHMHRSTYVIMCSVHKDKLTPGQLLQISSQNTQFTAEIGQILNNFEYFYLENMLINAYCGQLWQMKAIDVEYVEKFRKIKNTLFDEIYQFHDRQVKI